MIAGKESHLLLRCCWCDHEVTPMMDDGAHTHYQLRADMIVNGSEIMCGRKGYIIFLLRCNARACLLVWYNLIFDTANQQHTDASMF